jgi:hypothetical protein
MGTDAKGPEGWNLEGLPANGPYPELAEKLSLFGQFVGDWDILECRSLEEDGTWSTTRGKLHWRWILEGRAVQDIWTTIDKATQRSIPIGTTVRFYDPKIDAWHSVWLSPRNGFVRTFLGRPVGSEIVLEGKNSRGNSIRWIFSEITSDSFRWRGEELRTPPSGWVMYEEMRIRRARPSE